MVKVLWQPTWEAAELLLANSDFITHVDSYEMPTRALSLVPNQRTKRLTIFQGKAMVVPTILIICGTRARPKQTQKYAGFPSFFLSRACPSCTRFALLLINLVAPYFLLFLLACLSCFLLIYQFGSIRFNLVVGSLLSPLALWNTTTTYKKRHQRQGILYHGHCQSPSRHSISLEVWDLGTGCGSPQARIS